MQIFRPPALQLVNIAVGASGSFNGVIPFRIPTPDSRVMASVALIWSELNPAAVPFDITYSGGVIWALWLAGRTDDTAGSGVMIPTVNLVGTKAVPLALPSDVDIDGYSDDFVGGQDEIYGELTVHLTSFIPRGLRVALMVRYEPVGCEICDDEWQEIVGQCNPQALAPAPVVF